MIEQLDAGRGAGAARPQREIDANVGVRNLRLVDLAQRYRRAQGAGRPRQAHRFQRIARQDFGATRIGLADTLQRQQRALDLNEMDVGCVGNAGILHRRAHALGDLLDFEHPAKLFERQRRRVSTADSQRGARAISALTAFQHHPMRRHAAFGAARHHQAYLVGRLHRQITAEQQRQMRGAETAAEVVDQAIALGLCQHGDDARRINPAGLDRNLDAADVIGRGGGDSVNFGDGHPACLSAAGASPRRRFLVSSSA